VPIRQARAVMAIGVLMFLHGVKGWSSTPPEPDRFRPSQESAAFPGKVLDALGGASQLRSLESFSVTLLQRDRVAQPRRGSAPPLPFQFIQSEKVVDVKLPDHFLVQSRMTSLPGVQNRWGFAGNTNIGEGPLQWRFREVFGYFILPLSWRLNTVFPFTLEGGNGPDIRLRDPNGVAVVIVVDSKTGRPSTVSYERIVRTMSGEPTGERVGTRMELSDYRSVDGIWLPHSLKVFEGDLLIEDRMVQKIALNVKFGPAHFR